MGFFMKCDEELMIQEKQGELEMKEEQENRLGKSFGDRYKLVPCTH